MRPIFPAGGFGFKLNYPKEIAADRALLAKIDRLLELELEKPDAAITPQKYGLDIVKLAAGGYSFGLADLIIYDADAAARLGYTLDDRQALAYALDWSDAECKSAGLPDDSERITDGAWYRRGDAIAKALRAIWEGDLYTCAQLKKLRSKAKADLARHLRNQAKYG